MNDKKKKKYVKPDAEVISFTNEDIITLSSGTDKLAWWSNGDDQETF